jgi:hypothetical protein
MPSRVDILRSIIHHHRTLGIAPSELHMNAVTRAGFAEEAGIKPQTPKDTRSLANRLWSHQAPPETVLEFDGLRVVDNPKIEGGAIIIRPAQLMGDPDWLSNVTFRREEAVQEAQQPCMPASGTPWHGEVDVNPSEVMQDALKGLGDGGGITPTTVLFKAVEGLDNVKDVVVLRFFRNGDIDFASTFDRYGVIGGLQAALQYVANGNGR